MSLQAAKQCRSASGQFRFCVVWFINSLNSLPKGFARKPQAQTVVLQENGVQEIDMGNEKWKLGFPIVAVELEVALS